jgi:CarD family transcriptional regulator
MAQKKNVSVSSVASKSSKEDTKITNTRAKPAATKKKAVRATTSDKPAAKAASKATVVKKPSAKAVSKTAKSSTNTATSAKGKEAAPKAAARKPAATKAATAQKANTAKNSPAAKAAASTKSKIAAAAQMVAARRAAAAKKTTTKAPDRALKAVAAAQPSPAKRSSAPVAAKPVAVAPEAPKKPAGVRHGFKLHEYVVYPAHGVGQIVAIEEQEIAGMSLELFVITFDKDKMTLRVPTAKVDAMRKLSESAVVEKAMTTLKGRARVKRTMWSRRAQEYENKINSGDLISIAEVVRDLYRSDSQPEQSYSERQLYEAALDRMARELAAVEKLDERGATQRITDVLSKSAKGRRQAEEDKAEAEAAAAAESEKGDGVEAA